MSDDVTMTFDNRRNCARIQLSTLRALGNPAYIIPMCNEATREFILKPTTIHEAREQGLTLWQIMNIPDDIYTKRKAYEYQNQNVMPWMRSFTGWRPYAQYRVKGKIVEGMAIMDLMDYDFIVGGVTLRIV